jgi:hypothetical protein
MAVRLGCAIWGHAVDNAAFRATPSRERRCRCGVGYLREDGSATHVRHTLSCFLRHHTYTRLADRDGVHEYVCIRCGHPLVFLADADPFDQRGTTLKGRPTSQTLKGRPTSQTFIKKVRYLCGLFGHRVVAVADRDGFVEYACHCGHSFLRPRAGARLIRHPLICFFRAHRVRFVTRRHGYAEYVCDDCGHPFCFADPADSAEVENG